MPVIIFEKKRKSFKSKVKKINKKTLKIKNDKVKKIPKTKNKAKLPDPLSPFAILKSMKIKK